MGKTAVDKSLKSVMQYIKTIIIPILAIFIYGNCLAQNWNDYHDKAMHSMKVDDYSTAISLFTKSIQLYDGSAPYLHAVDFHFRGYCNWILENYSTAKNDFIVAITVAEKNKLANDFIADNYTYMANCNLFLNKTNDACADLIMAKNYGYGSKRDEIITMLNDYCK